MFTIIYLFVSPPQLAKPRKITVRPCTKCAEWEWSYAENDWVLKEPSPSKKREETVEEPQILINSGYVKIHLSSELVAFQQYAAKTARAIVDDLVRHRWAVDPERDVEMLEKELMGAVNEVFCIVCSKYPLYIRGGH